MIPPVRKGPYESIGSPVAGRSYIWLVKNTDITHPRMEEPYVLAVLDPFPLRATHQTSRGTFQNESCSTSSPVQGCGAHGIVLSTVPLFSAEYRGSHIASKSRVLDAMRGDGKGGVPSHLL